MLLRLTLPILMLTAQPTFGLELDAMTDEERAIFGEEVRSYLLENPEVLQEAIGILRQREQNAQTVADRAMAGANEDALFYDDHSFVGGNPDGDVRIVEFLDYRCGFCKRAHPEVVALIEADRNIRYVIKELPILGEQSVLASRFAIATQLVAGDDAYKDVHDTLMEFQGDVTAQTLNRLGDTLGLDTAAITAAMDSDDVSDIIRENRALAQRLQISGTPTFVFEDQMVRGYVELAQMEQLVEELRTAN
ncbi:DsbA family protein [Yoonia sp. 2307UL14-13]